MICDGCKHALNCPAKAEYGVAIRCSAFKPLDKNVKNGYYNDDENMKIVMEWLKQPHKE